MNVTCPQCATVFRVDPAKVPERGIRARCSVCSGLIAVRRPPPTPPVVPSPAAPLVNAAPASAMPPAAIPVAPPMPAPPIVEAPRVVPQPLPAVPAPTPVATPRYTPEPVPVMPPAPPRTIPEPPPMMAPPPPAPRAPVMPPPPAPAPMAPPAAAKRFSNPFLARDADPAARARRLANSLATDLALYYPEKRERGLQEGNLKELFAEEIRKSWEEYVNQIGEEFATSTPYFTQALNEILAEGKPLFG